MKKRVFIAVDIPKAIQNTLTKFFDKVYKHKEVKWERAEKLHLTLAFLGFVEEEKVAALISIVKQTASKVNPLSLSIIPKIEGFPTTSNPRVLWLPLAGDIARLKDAADTVQKLLKDARFSFDEREFHGHLTVGRFRAGTKKWQKQPMLNIVKEALPRESIPFEVLGLTLFESRLTPKGSVYKVLAYEDFGN